MSPLKRNQLSMNIPFDHAILDKSVIAIPLNRMLQEEQEAVAGKNRMLKEPKRLPRLYAIIIDINLDYSGSRQEARERIETLIHDAIKDASDAPQHEIIDENKSRKSEQYIYASLSAKVIRKLAQLNEQATAQKTTSHNHPARPQSDFAKQLPIYRIWPDFDVQAHINRSICTVKCDAAQTTFCAMGDSIVWAVLDSGIDKEHPHFTKYENLILSEPISHRDFTISNGIQEMPLKDEFGHGTHVAGIIAGALDDNQGQPIYALMRYRDEGGDIKRKLTRLPKISGMAPKCKLVSLKTLDSQGSGQMSNLMTALSYIQEINGYGRRIQIHGVNISAGYSFDPEWFACGQSPLCVEIDRLVRSGVVVVISAGNTGYINYGNRPAGMDMTINDPGNAELAITVGSTHRDMPHVYGVSYYSSKGPTGDGRCKPDLIAPGEKIISCATGSFLEGIDSLPPKPRALYVEYSGTSMAAPHVSGAIAAFLSIRQEFIGKPERVKEIFQSTATDLQRDRSFQGHGLVDLMRAIQSV